jgi:3'-phosphoadenosine 5'-phosphosulfate sulfotransferase (PAPS reductase)/FAD synthetase
MKWNELEAEQKKDLDYKIKQATAIIAEAFGRSSNPAIAFSAGKDSTVLLHLIRATVPEQAARMPVIYGNTGVEYPECSSFARQLRAEWNLNLHEARPGKTDAPGLKYAAQRRVWDYLILTDQIGSVLKQDGKLKSTDALERAAIPYEMAAEFERERLIWPVGSMMSYWWCADQYGWPLLGKSWSKLFARRINIDTFLRFSRSESDKPELLAYYDVLKRVKISQMCCKILKKDPAERVQAFLGVDLIFKGLMASESRTRAKNFLTRGYLFEGKKHDYLHGNPFYHCQPLAIWTDEDIWAYIRRYQVPVSSLYAMTYYGQDGKQHCVKRNGCLGCGTDFGYKDNHLAVLRQTHRRAWDVIMRAGMGEQIRNLQRTMRSGQLSIFDSTNTEELIEFQPCVFDDLDGLGGMNSIDGLVYDPETDE